MVAGSSGGIFYMAFIRQDAGSTDMRARVVRYFNDYFCELSLLMHRLRGLVDIQHGYLLTLMECPWAIGLWPPTSIQPLHEGCCGKCGSLLAAPVTNA